MLFFLRLLPLGLLPLGRWLDFQEIGHGFIQSEGMKRHRTGGLGSFLVGGHRLHPPARFQLWLCPTVFSTVNRSGSGIACG